MQNSGCIKQRCSLQLSLLVYPRDPRPTNLGQAILQLFLGLISGFLFEWDVGMSGCCWLHLPSGNPTELSRHRPSYRWSYVRWFTSLLYLRFQNMFIQTALLYLPIDLARVVFQFAHESNEIQRVAMWLEVGAVMQHPDGQLAVTIHTRRWETHHGHHKGIENVPATTTRDKTISRYI